MSDTHREIELRLAIADRSALDRALQATGARPIGQGVVRTSTFDFADGRLRAARQTLRLREDWTGTTLTSKKPLAAPENTGRLKMREEVTLPLSIGSGDDALLILEHLGLHETLRYEKTRTSWQLGDARIDVDVLADGGECYAEIEAEPAVIAATRTRLGLDDTAVETRSYFEIVRQARQRARDIDTSQTSEEIVGEAG